MKRKILIIAATHGNEGFTIPILEKISAKNGLEKFDWMIANPRALRRGIRFIDADLNRVAPGNPQSSQYEIRRASELQKIFSKYETVIDLHGTPASTGIFTIVTNPKIENLCLAASLPIEKVVIWSPRNLNQPGPLTQFVSKGLEIECGPKESLKIQNNLENILEFFLNENNKFDPQKFEAKSFYRVYGTLTQKEYQNEKVKLKEFEAVEIGGEKFFPLLINRYEGIVCYKMEEIDFLFKQMFMKKCTNQNQT